MHMLDKAIRIAASAHEGQKDKAGQPYILHPLRVMFRLQNEVERICAVLHDVIEDTDVTLEDLRRDGFSEVIISALTALTKQQGESYDDFIGRVLGDKIACKVKLADLEDNMDPSRLPGLTEEDLNRMEKYRRAVERIKRGNN